MQGRNAGMTCVTTGSSPCGVHGDGPVALITLALLPGDRAFPDGACADVPASFQV